MTDKQNFTVIIGRLFLAFNVEASTPLINVYWEALRDLPIADIQRAVAEIIKTETDGYKPVPGKIRQFALGSVEALAMIAWQELNRAIHKYGAYRDPVFCACGPIHEDPRIGLIVNQHGGWVQICGMPEIQFNTWFRKSFFADYETMRNHDLLLLKQLTGLTTAANRPIENEIQWLEN